MMNREGEVSRRGALAAAVTLLGAGLAGVVDARRVRKPNIIFILADDLGAFDLSCYGRPDYRTPRIDSLARDGMKFSFAYSNSSTCVPTRVGLISGRYQNRLPVGLTMGGGLDAKMGYPVSLPSLPRLLKTAGYYTALVGKWNLGAPPEFSPIRSGYDEFFGIIGGTSDYWTHDSAGRDGERVHDLYENETEVEREGYLTDLFSDRAVDIIERSHERPFFLSLHYNAPHFPWQTRTDRGTVRFNDVHYDGGNLEIYAQMVQAMDEGVGRVLDAVERFRIQRETIIVFTSDNGGDRFSYTWPLRGEKGKLWEGGVRVPLLVRWPGRISRGSQSDQVTLSMDWLPTLCAIAGVGTDPAYPPDGTDITPQLLGGRSMARTVFWRSGADESALAYPWKYLKQSEYEYLYNLAEDVTEQANLKLRNPAEFARLKAALTEWSGRMLPAAPAADWRVLEALEALELTPARP